jgi:hypothetical protein
MSDRPPIGVQLQAITPAAPVVQISFDLKRLEIGLSTGLGSDFMHYRAMPSPIGKGDRGDLRRNDGVDTITSNGMLYRCAGVFTATMTDNEREQKLGAAGLVDPSAARLVMPRFYNANGGVANGDRIYLAPGDRLYFNDPNADVKVANYQEIDYQPDADNVPMFPIVVLQDNLIDSRNIEYVLNVDFTITAEGNIRWIAGGKNPGIDPDTGKGRIYSIRYLYNAFYYVYQLPKEVRVTNVTEGGERVPERMPMHAIVVREYIFHNQNKGDKTNQNISRTPQRAVSEPIEPINPNSPVIPVDMTNFRNNGDDDEGNL